MAWQRQRASSSLAPRARYAHIDELHLWLKTAFTTQSLYNFLCSTAIHNTAGVLGHKDIYIIYIPLNIKYVLTFDRMYMILFMKCIALAAFASQHKQHTNSSKIRPSAAS